ncbi:16S rRNA (guanine(966)-N(2))-methyltransferase RsmD [Lentilactobacillus laojiaonis]|uniref:16S rRNA (guanine(966)-N(2))-methyltransferase RsmD n=1 Tax=Lentilactobacillus laojiaonis TaxID=2883998 RepID=UPI001D0B9015|nr:16S rRNA (guanine(966)-N(2))-methyltransferase RsmD [Lentilactobacillus laojiaonis]UDM32508.1 16S rRNA (guanine(966)-N(2))-methyltransferase RsmD [Lentilactobacillus laojiaonis]
MRIVSGEFGGIRLDSVKSNLTRPTTDKVKESLFSMIGPYFDGGVFLDMYAGSGAVGIEAVSRGMDKAVLIDRQFQAIKTINSNIEKTHNTDKFMVMKGDSKRVLQKLSGELKFDMVFLDPPYKDQRMLKDIDELINLSLLNSSATIVCETDNTVELPSEYLNCKLIKFKEYGLTNLFIYRYEGELND